MALNPKPEVVYISCGAGQGRTGLLATILVALMGDTKGRKGDAVDGEFIAGVAAELVKKSHARGLRPETPEQKKFARKAIIDICESWKP